MNNEMDSQNKNILVNKIIKQKHLFVISFVLLIFFALVVFLKINKKFKVNNLKELKNVEQTQNAEDESGGKYVQAFRVKKILFTDKIEGLVGTVKSSSIELKSGQEEKLVKYNFKPGDYIKKGQVIAELDHTRLYSRMRKEQINLERKTKLFEIGAATKIEVEDAQASYNIAKKDYEETFIVAPKNGYLGEILIEEGELVPRQGTVAYFVTSDEAFYVETSVIESDVKAISVGQEVKISVDFLGEQSITGKIISVSPEAMTTSRMVPIRVSLPQKYMAQLKPGVSASCEIIIFNKECLVIPSTALDESGSFVWLIGENDIADKKEVKVGYKSRSYTEVLSGLVEGDIVVSNPGYVGIKDKTKVKYSTAE